MKQSDQTPSDKQLVQLNYEDWYTMGHNNVYVIRWPYNGTSRDRTSMVNAIGSQVIVDGHVRDVVSFETFCLLSPLSIGSLVGVRVSPVSVISQNEID